MRYYCRILALVLILCCLIVPSALASDFLSMLKRDDETLDIDGIMGVPGTEIMADAYVQGKGFLYEYANEAAMMAASEKLYDYLLSNGYDAQEATLDTLAAIRFTKEGQEDVILAPHTDYPLAYVLVGAPITVEAGGLGFETVEENGVLTYQDDQGRRVTLNHADVLLDGKPLGGVTARFSSTSAVNDLFTFSCDQPEFMLTMKLPQGYMAEGGSYTREDFVGKDIACMVRVGGYYDGYGLDTEDDPDCFGDIGFRFSPVNHDQPVGVWFDVEYSNRGDVHQLEGFAVVLFEGASGGNVSTSPDRCTVCHGSGRCQVCLGRGYASYTTWGQGGSGRVTCTGCNGTGKCKYCQK